MLRRSWVRSECSCIHNHLTNCTYVYIFLFQVVMMKFSIIFCHLLVSLKAINFRFLPCDVDANVTKVDCHDRSLDRVIYIKDDRVLSLNLSLNRIRKVADNTFSGVPNLLTLDMTRNGNPYSPELDIHHCAFKVLPKLQHLFLSHNRLRHIPWLPESLRQLNLEGNRIFHIENPFETPHLEKLFLGYNCYYLNPCYEPFYIAENAFEHLTRLRVLDLAFDNLTAVPHGLPRSLERLNLKENRLTEIPDRAFVNLTKLSTLNLEWNCQRCDHAAQPCFPCPYNNPLKLHPQSFFSENSSIGFLSLRGNSIKTFPKGIFKPLKKLGRLDLSDNRLAFAIQNASFFGELTHLNWISLIYNYEPERIFTEFHLSTHIGKMVNLQYLLLTGNFFKSLSTQSLEVLSRLKKLHTLELRMNFMYKFDFQSLKRFPSLQRIILTQNMLTFNECPSRGLFMGQWEAISERQTIFSSRFQTGILGGRHISTEDKARTSWPSNTLDIEPFALSVLYKKLCNEGFTLDLSQNDILFLTNKTFAGLENVTCLDLSLNYMSQTLSKGDFSGLTKLVALNMSHNRIDLFYDHAFSELNKTLKLLDLSNNDFHFNMRGMFHSLSFIHNLQNLEVLSLANNNIQMRIDHQLNSSSLRTLYFNGNRLDNMWKAKHKYTLFFQNLTNLNHLDISNNQLRSISDDILTNLPKSLQSLVISYNQLAFFPWANITALSNLTLLDLSHNVLDFFPSTILKFDSNLKCLYLNNNRFHSFPESVLIKLKSLQVLHLDHNQIKKIHFKFTPKPSSNETALKELTLHTNPFRCDCDTAWFSVFLATTSIHVPFLTTSVLCAYPESQIGKSILLIDQHSCQEIYGSLAFFVNFCVVILLTTLPLLKHLYGWDLWYCLQVLWAGQKGYSQLPGSDCHYHAFVVFDTGNPAVRDWVYNELVVHLEDRHRRFNLCLEERDWVPGLSCIENLHNAVYKSVKTVFVLSSGKALNGVIRQAFYMVQQRLLDEKADVAVLVLLEEMYTKLKYLQLRKRLCGKSVLTWPKNPLAQPLFWNQENTDSV
ncbi:toll-like receptor 7 isoform 2-T2 [Synchiropus picturatus]